LKQISEIKNTENTTTCEYAVDKLWDSLNEKRKEELRAKIPRLTEPEAIYDHIIKIYEECRVNKQMKEFDQRVDYWLATQDKGTEEKFVKYAAKIGWGTGHYGQPYLYGIISDMKESKDATKGPTTVEIDLEGVRPGEHVEHGIRYVYNPSNKKNPVRIKEQPHSTKVNFKMPEPKPKGKKGADALAALALPAMSEVTKVKSVEDLIEKTGEKVSDKEKKKALEAYEHHSQEFKKLYPIYAKVEGGTINLFMEMVQDLLNTGEYTKTEAVQKVATDHKGIRGFSRASFYRNTAPELKRKWVHRKPLPTPNINTEQLYETVLKVRDQLIAEDKMISAFRADLELVLPAGVQEPFMEYVVSLGICPKDTQLDDMIFTIWQNGVRDSDPKAPIEQPSLAPAKIIGIRVPEEDDDPGIYEDSCGVTYKLSTRTGLDRIAEVLKAPENMKVASIMWRDQNILKGAIPDIPNIPSISNPLNEQASQKSQNETLESTAVTGKIDGVLHTFTLNTLMESEPENLDDALAMIAQFRKTLLPAYKELPPDSKVFETYKTDIRLMEELESEKLATKTLSASLDASHAENRRLNAEKQELLSRLGEAERRIRELQERLQQVSQPT